MYELKTILPEFEIQLPTTMYAMKNQCGPQMNGFANGQLCAEDNDDLEDRAAQKSVISSTNMKGAKCALDLDVLGQQIQQILKSSNEVGAVLVRQDKVLQQLKDLKSQLAEIRSTLGVCQKGIQHTIKPTANEMQNSGKNGGLRDEPLHDIVINAQPKFIPYALLALKHAWQDTFDINVKTFTHSTIADVGTAAREFEQKLQESESSSAANSNKPQVNVTLIWKNCEHTEMISSPTMYVPIYGEVNIIRYFGRIGPEAFRYEDSPFCNEIDLVLDICHQLMRCNTPKGIATMLRSLNQRLGKQQFFGGDTISVADIGVHSSLKQRMASIKDKDLTPALIAWRKRAELVTRI